MMDIVFTAKFITKDTIFTAKYRIRDIDFTAKYTIRDTVFTAKYKGYSFYSNSDIIIKRGNFLNKCCKMKFEGVCRENSSLFVSVGKTYLKQNGNLIYYLIYVGTFCLQNEI